MKRPLVAQAFEHSLWSAQTRSGWVEATGASPALEDSWLLGVDDMYALQQITCQSATPSHEPPVSSRALEGAQFLRMEGLGGTSCETADRLCALPPEPWQSARLSLGRGGC